MGSRIPSLDSPSLPIDPDPYALPIPNAEGLRGRHIGKAVVIVGPCGQIHTMSLAAGRALAQWLNQHCQPVREAEFITIDAELGKDV